MNMNTMGAPDRILLQRIRMNAFDPVDAAIGQLHQFPHSVQQNALEVVLQELGVDTAARDRVGRLISYRPLAGRPPFAPSTELTDVDGRSSQLIGNLLAYSARPARGRMSTTLTYNVMNRVIQDAVTRINAAGIDADIDFVERGSGDIVSTINGLPDDDQLVVIDELRRCLLQPNPLAELTISRATGVLAGAVPVPAGGTRPLLENGDFDVIRDAIQAYLRPDPRGGGSERERSIIQYLHGVQTLARPATTNTGDTADELILSRDLARRLGGTVQPRTAAESVRRLSDARRTELDNVRHEIDDVHHYGTGVASAALENHLRSRGVAADAIQDAVDIFEHGSVRDPALRRNENDALDNIGALLPTASTLERIVHEAAHHVDEEFSREAIQERAFVGLATSVYNTVRRQVGSQTREQFDAILSGAVAFALGQGNTNNQAALLDDIRTDTRIPTYLLETRFNNLFVPIRNAVYMYAQPGGDRTHRIINNLRGTHETRTMHRPAPGVESGGSTNLADWSTEALLQRLAQLEAKRRGGGTSV